LILLILYQTDDCITEYGCIIFGSSTLHRAYVQYSGLLYSCSPSCGNKQSTQKVCRVSKNSLIGSAVDTRDLHKQGRQKPCSTPVNSCGSDATFTRIFKWMRSVEWSQLEMGLPILTQIFICCYKKGLEKAALHGPYWLVGLKENVVV
jgi:hypothetical protein